MESEVLDQATALFWAKGFDATSLDDLSAATGMGRPSLYHAFGDKEAIFMRCLERYSATVCAQPLSLLPRTPDVREAIAAYLKAVAEYVTKDETRLGCMLGAVPTTVDERTVREFVAAKIAFAEQAIANRLQKGIEDGQLPPDFPTQPRARRTITAMLAISTRARHGIPLQFLLEDAEDGTITTFA